MKAIFQSLLEFVLGRDHNSGNQENQSELEKIQEFLDDEALDASIDRDWAEAKREEIDQAAREWSEDMKWLCES